MEALEEQLDRRRDRRGRLVAAGEVGDRLSQRGLLLEQRHVLGRRDVLTGVDHGALFERGDDRAEALGCEPVLEHGEHSGLHEVLGDLGVAALFEGLDLDLPHHRRGERVEIADARRDVLLAVAERAACGVGDHHLVVRDGEPHRHAGPLVDVGARPGQVGQRGDDLGHVVGHRDANALGLERHRLRQRDRHLGVDLERVVGADLRPEAVLQRGDDPTAVRVVLRVGRREEDQVEREADLVAAHLDVALLQHVEETDLDALGEVGQLVDGEDAAVRARDEAVVEGELVGQVAALGHLDRVDLTDQVGDGRVRGGELLAVATGPVDPLDRGVLTVLGHLLPPVARHRCVGIVVDL